MRVKFREKWFGPSEPYKHTDNRVFKGTNYEKGEVYELDPEMRPLLPKSAVILDDDFEEPVEEVREAPSVKEPEGETLRDHDHDRKSDDQFTEKMREAEENAALFMKDKRKKQ